LNAVFSNLTGLYILADFRDGSGGNGDNIGLDNVKLPESPFAPTLTSIMPSSGSVGATLYMRLTGTKFTPGSTTVQVSGTGVHVAKVNIDKIGTATRLTAKLVIDPQATPGPRDVTVSTPAGGVSNTQTFTVSSPVAACEVALPLTVTGRGNLTISAGIGTSRPISGRWVTALMVFREGRVSFQGTTLSSATLPASNPPASRMWSANVEPLAAVVVLNAFYSPYLCGYSVVTPNAPVSRANIELILNSVGVNDFNGSVVEIPRF
jgi:hypothetical protein